MVKVSLPEVWEMSLPRLREVRSKVMGVPEVPGWVGVEYEETRLGDGEEPGSPWGIVKLSTAFWGVPELVTWAGVPGAPVVTVPMVMVAAAPAGPGGHTQQGSWTGQGGREQMVCARQQQ